MTGRAHRYVQHEDALEYCRLGWLPLPDLDGTSHGQWSILCAWICDCPIIQPDRSMARELRDAGVHE